MSHTLAEPSAAPSMQRLAWIARVFSLSADARELVQRAYLSRGLDGDCADRPVRELMGRGLVVAAGERLALVPRIHRHLDGDDRLDDDLTSFVSITGPRAIGECESELVRSLVRLATQCRAGLRPLRVHLRGPRGVGKRYAAHAVASAMGSVLLSVDLRCAPPGALDVRPILVEAWLRDAILLVSGLDSLLTAGREAEVAHFARALGNDSGMTFLATENGASLSRLAPEFISIAVGVPSSLQRRAIWRQALAANGIEAGKSAIEAVASRFQLVPGRIRAAAAETRGRLEWAAARGSPADVDTSMFASARRQSRNGLESLASRIDAKIELDQLVLPEETLTQLRELRQRILARDRVMTDWGFQEKLQYGTSPTALFFGPPGTGKSMCAAALARSLDLDAFQVKIARVVSRYVGTTARNLERIFTAAEKSNALLFFDEADALFGKRSETIKDAHDRYSNGEISFLLQRMESYDSVAILASNMRAHLDEAFTRRLAFLIHFPLPDEAARERIWRGVWPAAAPLSRDVDFARLARGFPLSGGNIKNIALSAAFEATRGGPRSRIAMRDILRGVQREYAKMGKSLDADELAQGLGSSKPAR